MGLCVLKQRMEQGHAATAESGIVRLEKVSSEGGCESQQSVLACLACWTELGLLSCSLGSSAFFISVVPHAEHVYLVSASLACV